MYLPCHSDVTTYLIAMDLGASTDSGLPGGHSESCSRNHSVIVEDSQESSIDHLESDVDMLFPGEDEGSKCLPSSEEQAGCAVVHTERSRTTAPNSPTLEENTSHHSVPVAAHNGSTQDESQSYLRHRIPKPILQPNIGQEDRWQMENSPYYGRPSINFGQSNLNGFTPQPYPPRHPGRVHPSQGSLSDRHHIRCVPPPSQPSGPFPAGFLRQSPAPGPPHAGIHHQFSRLPTSMDSHWNSTRGQWTRLSMQYPLQDQQHEAIGHPLESQLHLPPEILLDQRQLGIPSDNISNRETQTCSSSSVAPINSCSPRTACKRGHLRKVEKKYQCEICTLRFERPSNLKTHHLTHTGEKPFPCSWCEKAFTTASNLTRHKRRLHQEELPESRNHSIRTGVNDGWPMSLESNFRVARSVVREASALGQCPPTNLSRSNPSQGDNPQTSHRLENRSEQLHLSINDDSEGHGQESGNESS